MNNDTKQNAIAIFDLDGTIARSNLVKVYLSYVNRMPSFWRRKQLFLKQLALIPVLLLIDYLDRHQLNHIFYSQYKGLDESFLKRFAGDVAKEAIIKNYHQATIEKIRWHQQRGDTLVLITGNLSWAVEEVGQALGFSEVISSQLAFTKNTATGKLSHEPIAGDEKCRLIKEIAHRYSAELDHSYAYTDHISDLAMLELIGFPVPVKPCTRLRKEAKRRNWKILE